MERQSEAGLAPVRDRAPTGKPRTHACADCPTLVTAGSTRCKPCAARMVVTDPSVRAKLSALARARLADPLTLAKVQDNMRRVAAEARKCPAFRAWQRENGRRQSASVSAARMAWCPVEYRDAYRRMMRSHGAAKARARIEATIKADVAQLSPFERQERALRRGATLVANDRLYR